MKKLNMIFLNSLGKQVTLTPTLAKEDLDKETVQKLMTDISDLGIFEKDDVKLYSTPKAAKYVETITTEIF
ncbi:DUF2922 domain-containing protein [Vagococcus silagei]|uniref:DUF2922 domain-containing protein n=1 Tax=Vagococcus silagei TaxID=2508885 RepID=A0A4S3B6U0_9ENTE|nr:DUF2922 domain-containing protein [Vagococcus silagei]THB62137.1 DUF2922 domain-containing protein [Vagococcus silagei]